MGTYVADGERKWVWLSAEDSLSFHPNCSVAWMMPTVDKNKLFFETLSAVLSLPVLCVHYPHATLWTRYVSRKWPSHPPGRSAKDHNPYSRSLSPQCWAKHGVESTVGVKSWGCVPCRHLWSPTSGVAFVMLLFVLSVTQRRVATAASLRLFVFVFFTLTPCLVCSVRFEHLELWTVFFTMCLMIIFFSDKYWLTWIYHHAWLDVRVSDTCHDKGYCHLHLFPLTLRTLAT